MVQFRMTGVISEPSRHPRMCVSLDGLGVMTNTIDLNVKVQSIWPANIDINSLLLMRW